ncbi:hypothetical protein NDU88_003990 [Pleurodeles waltl]|uniref:Uncharacterized protein n=1 Tax=Pleurodeles waltl TaxID=8319 RepID=A0AAV7NR94_PLEWA|nr:hypothetical protein NDU88_003990 [Pleurodeles waltl]
MLSVLELESGFNEDSNGQTDRAQQKSNRAKPSRGPYISRDQGQDRVSLFATQHRMGGTPPLLLPLTQGEHKEREERTRLRLFAAGTAVLLSSRAEFMECHTRNRSVDGKKQTPPQHTKAHAGPEPSQTRVKL